MAGGDPRLCVLITGFGPFPGAPFNPTGDLVRALCKVRRPAFAQVRRVGHVFETSYTAVDAGLPTLIAQHHPHIVLMFGLAARTPFVRIETVARNTYNALLADASGALPAGRTIALGAPSRRRGRAPFVRLLTAARTTRVPVRLSDNAGRYLCNYLYWRASELADEAAPRLFMFVHVPKVRRTTRPRSVGAGRSMTAPDLARVGEAILRTLVAVAHH